MNSTGPWINNRPRMADCTLEYCGDKVKPAIGLDACGE